MSYPADITYIFSTNFFPIPLPMIYMDAITFPFSLQPRPPQYLVSGLGIFLYDTNERFLISVLTIRETYIYFWPTSDSHWPSMLVLKLEHVGSVQSLNLTFAYKQWNEQTKPFPTQTQLKEPMAKTPAHFPVHQAIRWPFPWLWLFIGHYLKSLLYCCEDTPWPRQLLRKKAFNWGLLTASEG